MPAGSAGRPVNHSMTALIHTGFRNSSQYNPLIPRHSDVPAFQGTSLSHPSEIYPDILYSLHILTAAPLLPYSYMLVIRTHLEKMGFRITEAVNGKEAIIKYAENDIDLIFMDIHMPEMNGYEATRKIREFEAGKKRAPIIALTADAFRDDRDKCLSEGMDFYLAKPFRPEEIVKVIRRFMPDRSKPVNRDYLSADHQIKQLRIFDRDGFMDRISGNITTYNDVIALFLEKFPKQLSVLSSLIEKQDLKGICRQSHSMQGMCLTLGAEILADVAQKIEDIAGHNGSIEEIKSLSALSEPAFREFCREAGNGFSRDLSG